jgi:hypothetical protein
MPWVPLQTKGARPVSPKMAHADVPMDTTALDMALKTAVLSIITGKPYKTQ